MHILLDSLIFGGICAASYGGLRYYMIPWLRRLNVVDSANQRSLHSGKIPRGGGLIIAIFLLIICLFMLVFRGEAMSAFMALYVFAWALLGWLDDVFDLSVGLRFAIQIILSMVAIYYLVYPYSLYVGIWFVYDLSPVLSVIAAVVGLVWCVNVYNFMDGIDGLSAIQCVIFSLFWYVLFSLNGDRTVSLMCLTLAAASCSFLLLNWHPAKVFLGDTGSILMGSLFAMLAVMAALHHQIPLISSGLLLGVFIADATITLIRRLLNGEKIWRAHCSHYFQRLAIVGISHRKIVIGYTIAMLICALLSLISIYYRDMITLLCVMYVVLTVACIFWIRSIEARHGSKPQIGGS